MLNELISIHRLVMATTPTEIKRYLFNQINWNNQAICILGCRGIGKTILMCQRLLTHYKDVEQALYISADNIHVLSYGLFTIAKEYFQYGGQALFIDEIHKYPNWALEIKNIIDTYKNRQLVFSASSSLDLSHSKYDLSRRVIYYELKGLSFREYLIFNQTAQQHQLPVLSFPQILKDHVKLVDQSFKELNILKYFRGYLSYGYFPFFLEGQLEYLTKITNIIEKVISEDIAVVYNLRQPTLLILKKLLWLIATSNGLAPNIDRISKNLQISRSVVYSCLEYLDRSGLINNLYVHAKGMKLMRKPGKVYLENTNLLCAINGDLHFEDDIGGIRETFFINQVSTNHKINLTEPADFIIDKKWTIEVGGRNKNQQQIKHHADAYLAIDNIEIGFGKKIPLYLFGFLY